MTHKQLLLLLYTDIISNFHRVWKSSKKVSSQEISGKFLKVTFVGVKRIIKIFQSQSIWSTIILDWCINMTEKCQHFFVFIFWNFQQKLSDQRSSRNWNMWSKNGILFWRKSFGMKFGKHVFSNYLVTFALACRFSL